MDADNPTQLDSLFVLTAAQQRLVDLVGQIFGSHTRWPNFDYVKRELRRTADLDATDVIDTFPSVPLVHSQRYGALWASTMRPIPRESEIRLSVLGASLCPLTTGNASSWLGFVSTLSELARHQRVDPFEVQPRDIETSAIWSMRQIPPPPVEKAVLDLLVREPLTGEANPRDSAEGWVVTIPQDIDRYSGPTSMREYVQWTVDNYGAPEVEQRMVPSPFSLPAAIDYLDVVWHLRFGKPLVRLKGAERTAQLAFDAGTADEFYGRMSALGETLARFDIDVSKELVRAEDGALDRMPRRMRALLHGQLSDEHRPRVDDATGRLSAAAAVRHGGQHADAAVRAGESYAALGLKYPIASYQEAWWTISNVVANALNDIREEIQSEGAQGTDE